MGTNYYLHTDVCPHCKRSNDKIHIGKESGGWVFMIQGHAHLYSFEDATRDFLSLVVAINTITDWYTWKRIIKLMPKSWKIKDEYGRIVGRTTFVKLVEDSYKDKKNWKHADRYPSEKDYIDKDGYSITETDFS